MIRIKQILAVILSVMMLLSVAACGNTDATEPPVDPTPSEPTTPAPTDTPTTPEPTPEVPAEPKILRRSSGAAAASAYPMMSQTDADSDIQGMICGKLYSYAPIDGNAVRVAILAAAEPVDVNGDGTVWNIEINPDAKWENGEPITAETFEYSWKMALDPKLAFQYAGTLAKNVIEIKNAMAYVGQSAEGAAPVAWEEVGIKVVENNTIQITTAKPATASLVMRHFSTSVAAPVYQPLYEECLSADGTSTTYGTTIDKVMSSGVWKLTNWVVGSIREYEKNEYWPNADMVNLDGYVQLVVEDANTELQMFEAGELDHCSLSLAARNEYGDDPRIVTVPSKYVRTFDFCTTNTEEPILANENFRKAIYYGTDRANIAKLSGDTPATAYITPLAIANEETGVTFRNLAAAKGYDQLENYGYDPVLAKQYFDKALAEVGVDSVEITLLCSTSSDHSVISEYVQEDWSKIFGADKFSLVIDAQPSKNQLAQKKTCIENPNAYEMTICDYTRAASVKDPLQGLTQFTSAYTNKNAPYADANIDAMYAYGDNDTNYLNIEKRSEVAMEIEEYMIEHAICVPVIYNSTFQMVSDRIELAMGQYDEDLGWGWTYCDIIQ